MKFRVLRGTHSENGKLSVKGQQFESDIEWDKSFPSRFEVIDDSDRPSDKPPKTAEIGYKIKRRRGGGYDVARTTDDKVMNDGKLSKEKADELVKSLI